MTLYTIKSQLGTQGTEELRAPIGEALDVEDPRVKVSGRTGDVKPGKRPHLASTVSLANLGNRRADARPATAKDTAIRCLCLGGGNLR